MATDHQVNGVAQPSLEERLSTAQAEGLAANLKRVLAFVSTGGPVEFQALEVTSGSGRWSNNQAAHARTPADAIALATEADTWDASGIYIVPSRLAAGVETRHRAPGSWYVMAKGASTTDRDVDRRCVVSVDCDVVRPAAISATDAQVAKSVETALRVWDWLLPVVGADALAYVHSGNGRQVWIALDALPANDDLRLLLASILAGLEATFGTAAVKIDQTLSDHKRLLPACGTTKKKGAPGIAERPHRRTAIVTPAQPRRLGMDGLWDLHARLRDGLDEAGRAKMNAAKGLKSAKAKPSAAPRPERTDPFAVANALNPQQVAEWLDLFEAGTLRCPGCGEAQGVDVIDHGLKCLHDRCSGKGKHGFRTNVDLVMEVRGVDARAAYGLLAERFGLEPLRERGPRDDGTTGSSEPPPAFWDDGSPQADEEPAPPPPDPWTALVTPAPAAWFTTAPPNRAWLLRDSRTSNGDGVLPLGKVGQIIGEGGASKTMAIVQLAIAVATGTRWLGTFDVASPGRVFLALGEEDAEEAHRRLYRGARASKSPNPPEGSIVVLPLAGVPCAMLERDERGNLVEASFLPWIRAHLAASPGWRLVVVDPLSRFAGPDAETDNAAATRFMQSLESIAALTGATTLDSHHTNKMSRGKGPIDGNAGRGSTGLFDAARWQCGLSAEQVKIDDPETSARLGEVVTFAVTKSNYARKPEPILLRRDPENGGALLPLDADDLETVREARDLAPARRTSSVRTAAVDAKTRQDAEALYPIIRANPGVGTRKLLDKSRLGPPALGRALEALEQDGRIANRPEQHGQRTDPHYFAREEAAQ